MVNNLISSSLDKVTAGTYNLQSFIASVTPVIALSPLRPSISLCSKLVITQFLSHFNSKDTSQLINGIFSTLQKLPKYFNGIVNYTSWVPFLFRSKPSAPAFTLYVLPIILFLYLNVFELTILILSKLLLSASSLNSSL